MQTFVPRNGRRCPDVWPQSTFNPVLLDTDQWVKTAASFGAKYYVLVADHFSGFSTWPTAVPGYNYSVAGSPWRGGKGDIVADFVASCKRYGVRPALYYSVHANWREGVCSYNLTSPAKQAAFEDAAMMQLEELAARYGADLANIWFDAGVRQSPAFVARVNAWVSTKLPATVTCHSCENMADVHAVSWMGNEETVMPYPNWNANDDQCSRVGTNTRGGFGLPGGTRWCAAHSDAVLRKHFWFWDKATYNDTTNLNGPATLAAMHLTSVGRGANMILDMSPTDSGLIQDNDAATYAGMGSILSRLYSKPAASASGVIRGQSVVEISVPAGAPALTRGAIELRENLTMGQAISNYTVSRYDTAAGGWVPLPLHNERQLTIGNRRIQFWAGVEVTRVRVSVATLQLASGPAVPHLRSAVLFDWSDPSLNGMLTAILKVP